MKSKISKSKICYLIFLISFFYYYLTGTTYYGEDVSEVVKRYLGDGSYIINALLILNYFTMNIKEKKKRDHITLISYSIYPVYLSIMFIVISFNIGVMTGNHIENLKLYFIQSSILDFKIGLIGTYLFSLVIFTQDKYLYWGVFSGAVLLILFIGIALLNHLVLNNVRRVRAEYLKKRELERKEAEILEKIKIKEELEKRAVEQLLRAKENKERIIKERILQLNPLLKEMRDGDESDNQIKDSLQNQNTELEDLLENNFLTSQKWSGLKKDDEVEF